MQVISGIELRQQPIGMIWIARELVEINERIEVARGSDPCIQGLTVCFGVGARMVKRGTHKRRYGRAEHLNAMRVSARDDLFVGADKATHLSLMFGRWHVAFVRQHAEIIDALKND